MSTDGLGFDRDAAFSAPDPYCREPAPASHGSLKTGLLNNAVRQRGFTVVDVGNDTEISDFILGIMNHSCSSLLLLLQGSGALRQPVSCTSFFVTVQSLTVTSKNPFKSASPMGFCLQACVCYGQRSKCADLLNNYLSSIFIAFIFPSDSLSRLMGAEMAIYHIKYSIICLHAQAVLNMTARRFCRFFREPWSHFQYL